MPNGITAALNYRTWVFIKVKILCFLVLYLLVILILLSFISPDLRRLLARLDRGGLLVLFGFYLVITGVSMSAVSRWRAEMEVRGKMANMPIEAREIVKEIRRTGHIVGGMVFVVLGAGAFVFGFGLIRAWWPPFHFFGTVAGRLVLLLMLNLPMLLGSAYMSAESDTLRHSVLAARRPTDDDAQHRG